MEDQHALNATAEAEGRRLLMAAFETAPAGDFAARADLAGRLRRESRRRRVRTVLPAGAAVAAAAAVGVTLTASVASPPSALAAVTSAAARTSGQSFRITEVSKLKLPPPRPAPPGVPRTPPLPRTQNVTHVNGTFDPRHARGEETSTGHMDSLQSTKTGWKRDTFHWRHKVRFVGGHIYVWYPHTSSYSHGKHWLEGLTPWTFPSVSRGSQIAKGFLDGRPVSPAQLLGLLKSADSVTGEGPASGPGWTGTKYGFTVRLPEDDHTTMTGTAYVDNQGRVRRLVTVTTRLIPARIPAPPKNAATPTATATVPAKDWKAGPQTTDDVTFSDFGTPVSVSAPPASDTYNLGKYVPNYLGFL